jgi:hypothetical protein
MAWHSDLFVRDIGYVVRRATPEGIGDAVELEEIAEAVMEAVMVPDDPGSPWPTPVRAFAAPRATDRMTKDEAVEASTLASQIVDWARHAGAYGDYSGPPWEEYMEEYVENPSGELHYKGYSFDVSPYYEDDGTELWSAEVFQEVRDHPLYIPKKVEGKWQSEEPSLDDHRTKGAAVKAAKTRVNMALARSSSTSARASNPGTPNTPDLADNPGPGTLLANPMVWTVVLPNGVHEVRDKTTLYGTFRGPNAFDEALALASEITWGIKKPKTAKKKAARANNPSGDLVKQLKF